MRAHGLGGNAAKPFLKRRPHGRRQIDAPHAASLSRMIRPRMPLTSRPAWSEAP
jgi:hypothetical protein